MVNKGKKITVLGVGNVGATIAYTLAQTGMAAEIVLCDINKAKAEGEAMDITQGSSVGLPVNIYAADYSAAANSDIIIVTLGMGRKPGQSRIDLAQCNVNITKSVMPQIAEIAPNAIYVVVSNPVDIITYTILKCTNLQKNQVIGSGTMLDTARLRSLLSEHVKINSHNVHAYVFGEHGDSSIIPWSLTSVAGMKMKEYCTNMCDEHNKCNKEALVGIENDMRTAGSRIIANKGATFYAIAMVVKKICESIFNDARTTLTISSMLEGEYGISDVCLSIPYLVGASGIIKSMAPTLTKEEKDGLQKSAEALKEVIASLTF
ncbi:MAG: L-lactate dehydrogenase [Clostridia bacterium]